MPERNISPVPPGAMVKVGMNELNGGKFVRQANSKLAKIVKGLLEFEEETGDMTGKALLTMKIVIRRLKNSADHFEVGYTFTEAVPSCKNVDIVKEAGGRLLCQPAGASGDNPDQLLLFDSQGRIISGVDKDTGETALVEAEAKPEMRIRKVN